MLLSIQMVTIAVSLFEWSLYLISIVMQVVETLEGRHVESWHLHCSRSEHSENIKWGWDCVCD